MKSLKTLLMLLIVAAFLVTGCAQAEPAAPAESGEAAPAESGEAAPVEEEPAAEEPAAPAEGGDIALTLSGDVANEMAWTEAEVKAMDAIEAESTNKDGETSTYTGVLISDLLALAQPNEGANTVTFVADDGYSGEATLEEVLACPDCIISFRNQGGFSTVLPGFSGKLQVKGVVTIEVTTVEAAADEPAAEAPAVPTLILATTTSTQDSGLLDVLVPLFQEQTGYVVQTVAVGTGAALKMAEEGNADVLLVHAPASEKALMDAGWGKDRMLVMHNDFVIVGPADDPAGIQGIATALEAFQMIADAGADFITRGDDSGTNKMEISLWGKTQADPNGQAWYIDSGQGMGATLTITSEKQAYTLTDRATYLANKENLDLAILVEGDAALLNVYHVMTVNPDKWPKSNYEGALAFADFMTSPETQAVIGEFGVDKFGQPLFFPDADKTDADLGLE